jgi:hypothetical protein
MDSLLKLPRAALSKFAEHDDILPEQVGGRLLGALARRPHTAVVGRGEHSMAQVFVVGQPGFYQQTGETKPRALAKAMWYWNNLAAPQCNIYAPRSRNNLA